MRVQLELDGTAANATPFIMHSEVLADPISPEARSVAEISGKRKKTEADHYEMGRREWLGGMYRVEGVGPVMPTSNILASLVDGARMTRLGTTVEAAVFATDEWVPLEYDGPRDPDALWQDGRFTLRKGVKLGKVRVSRTRPIFRDWRCVVELTVEPLLLDYFAFQAIATAAGRYKGIGDNRRKGYGRYAAKCVLLSDEADLFPLFDLEATQADRDATLALVGAADQATEAHLTKNRKNGKT